MSAKMLDVLPEGYFKKRNKKTRNKTPTNTPTPPTKKLLHRSPRKTKQNIEHFGFESEASSSLLKPDRNPEKKIRKRKIRCTQDFNQLSSSFSLQESHKSIKIKKNISKKTKELLNLPKITNISPNVKTNENKIEKKRSRKWKAQNVEQSNSEVVCYQTGVISKQSKYLKAEKSGFNNNTTEEKSGSDNDLTSFTRKKKTKSYESIKSVEEENDSISFKNSCSGTDPKMEIEFKRKMSKNKKSVAKNMTDSDYAEKIRQMLVNDEKQSKVKSANSDEKMKLRRKSDIVESPRFYSEKKSGNIKMRKKKPLKIETDKKSKLYVSFEKNDNSKSSSRLCNSIGSDGVFYKNNESDTCLLQSASHDKIDNKIRTSRKSVRFISSKEPIDDYERSFTVMSDTKQIENKTAFTHNESKTSPIEDVSINDNTFEIETPIILDKSNMEHNKFEVSGINLLRNDGRSELSTSETLSSIYKTPNEKGINKLDSLQTSSNLNMTWHFSGTKNKRNTFDKKCEHKNTIIGVTTPITFDRKSIFSVENTAEPIPIVQNKSNYSIEKKQETPKNITLTKLNRSATFTKEVSSGNYIKNLPVASNYESPLNLEIEIDSSKVNKRRRWDKSKLSIGYDGSMNISNISQPALFSEIVENASNDGTRNVIKENKENLQKCINPGIKIFSCNTPPSESSTPLQAVTQNLKKDVLREEKVSFNKSKSKSETTEKARKLMRTKMPNFALIHQRANDKFESLSEMKQRKEIRAKLLISGKKPGPETSWKVKSPSKSKKLLEFNTDNLNTQLSKLNKTKSPSYKSASIAITEVKNLSVSLPKSKIVHKLTPVERKVASRIPKPNKVPNKVAVEQNGFTRYGFKLGTMAEKSQKQISKMDQMKAIANKTNVIKNSIEERRFISKCVRTNRRFELLMNLRNKIN